MRLFLIAWFAAWSNAAQPYRWVKSSSMVLGVYANTLVEAGVQRRTKRITKFSLCMTKVSDCLIDGEAGCLEVRCRPSICGDFISAFDAPFVNSGDESVGRSIGLICRRMCSTFIERFFRIF